MAGLGYKLFASGEVLTAANLQGYSVDQSVMVFASSAARTTALAAPNQGMLSWLNDSGTMWQYFELYNASTNPGGALAAGWYPINGSALFHATATRSLASSASYTALGSSGFTYTELADTLSWHSAATNTDRITPTVQGIYRVTAFIDFAGNASGVRQGRILKNGSTTAPVGRAYNGSPGSQDELTMVGISYMNGSTDYFTVDTLQDSGSSLTVNGTVTVEYIRPSVA